MADTQPFHQWIRLEQPRFGSCVVYATDEFFAAKERLIEPAEPVFVDGKYDDHGKWMDGWESRRKRGPGNDFCIIKLGVPGILHGVDVDTRYFTGNYPPAVSLAGCRCPESIPGPEAEWEKLLGETPVGPDAHHFLEIDHAKTVTHVRFSIYPDGGVARLRLYGEVHADCSRYGDKLIDLLALEHGGRALICSDEHYGSMHNLNVPGRGLNMGDGWETARRRGPGNDWVILALGAPGTIESIEVDTAHFKGNYPDRVAIDGVYLQEPVSDPQRLLADDLPWSSVLAESKLQMDAQHVFEDLSETGPFSHLRMRIFPDGGVSRLRVLGHPLPKAAE